MHEFKFSESQNQTAFHVIGIRQKNEKPVVPSKYEPLIQHREFKGKLGDTVLYQTEKETVLLLGMGVGETLLDFEKAGAHLKKAVGAWPSSTIAVTVSPSVTAEQMAYMASGAYLYAWKFDKYKTTKDDDLKTFEFVFVSPDEAVSSKKFAYLKSVNDGNITTREVVSEPPNVLFPESYAERIKKDLEPLGVTVTILHKKELEKKGMNAILSIGSGSQHDPCLVTLEYNGEGAGSRPIVLVGKGVTFDSGGISIKPAQNMEDMRHDMAGSGAVYGVIKSMALRKAKKHVVGVLGLAENMPSGSACRPADIVKAYSGQTIEIINTDAEGRVVLADALWHAQTEFEPRVVIDIATLTGAISVALGNEYAGLFSNNQKLAGKLIEAGKQVDEHLWEMPLDKAFDKDIDSDFADVKNIGSGRGAGSSTAAHFLKRFIKKGTDWAHLDIAGTAWDKKDRTLFPKGATGFGVRLLNAFIENYD